jgi:hypothetical protein
LTTLTAAPAESLRVLHFNRLSPPTSRRGAYRALNALVEHSVLARQEILGSRSVYHLGAAALTNSERVRARVSTNARKPLSNDDAGHAWLRASLWAELVAKGYEVGRGAAELNAVRRFLVDRQRRAVAQAKGGHAQNAAARVLELLRSDRTLAPLFRSRCSRCAWRGPLNVARTHCETCGADATRELCARAYRCFSCGHVSDAPLAHRRRTDPRRRCRGVPREGDHLGFDVAWRLVDNRHDVILIFVDDLGRDLVTQLRELPLRVRGQPKVPIVLRSTDAASVYDRRIAAWREQGPRHRALLRAFSSEGLRRLFPFVTTTTLVEVNEALQLNLNPDRKEPAHA